MPTITPASPPAAAVATPAPRHTHFRDFLSELNPLQYIPVIGTIYRAITGDRIPESAREAGSLVVSGLTGGPIGVATNIALLAAEKMTGIDPEKLGNSALASLGIGHSSAIATAKTPPAPSAAKPPASGAWSPEQLAAYGVTNARDGTLRHGNEAGSDVLNSLELARIEAPHLA